MTNEILAEYKYWKPYTLNKNDPVQTNTLEVIKVFIKKLEKEDRGYKNVWESHINIGN